MRRLIGAKRPKSTGGGGGQRSSMVLGPAPSSSMSSLSSSLEGGEGEEHEVAAASGSRVVGAAAAHAEEHEEDENEESPGVFFGHMGVDSTQEVVWAESPKFYRPLARQPGGRGTDALVQRELSLIHGLLGDKENGGGGNGDGADGAVAASASQASLAQQQSQQSLEAAKTPVAAKGGWRSDDMDEEEEGGRDGDRHHAGVGETQQDEEDDDEEGDGEEEGQGKPKKGGFSTAILRSLLFRKSPAPSKRSRSEAVHDAAPAKKGGANSSNSMPPPPTPHRSPGGTRKRPRPNQEGGSSSAAASANASAAAGGEQAAVGSGQGVGMSLLGGLARSLKQGRFKLGLWQQPSASPPEAGATATAGQGGGTQPAAASSAVAAATAAARDQKQDGKGDEAAADGAEAREGEGTPKAREQQRNFLQLLEKIDEKLSQSEEGGMDESRSLQDGEAMDVASDGGQSPTPAPPAEARPVEPPAPPAPTTPAAAPVAPAPAPVAAPPAAPPSMPPPPPPPLPTPPAPQQQPPPPQQQQPAPPQQAPPSSQPWEEDDSGMWTESDWDKILQLTQAPAGTTAAAPPAQASQPPPTPALPSQPVASATAQSGSEPPAPQQEANPSPPTAAAAATATGADATAAASSTPAAPAPNPPARPPAVAAQEPEEGGDARGAAFIPTEPAASYDRYEVLEVREEEQGKEARVRHQATGWEGTLAIGSPWDECEVGKGDIVHVFGTDAGDAAGAAAGPRHRTVVDRDRNFLIVHPDVLISPSAIISGVECERRAVLQDGISSSAYQSSVAVLGNIKHTMTQNALLLLNDRERALPQLRDGSIVGELERVADSVLARHRVELHGMAIPEADARQQLLDLIRPIVDWARLHYLPDAAQQQQQAGPVVHVERTEGVEENIWSAGLGLKGMIDATLLARPLDPSLQQQPQPQPGGASGLFPLELKSGSNSAQLQLLHRAQVMLYSLLLRDRYGPNPDSIGEGAAAGTGAAGGGVLAYVTAKGVEVHPVPPKANELRHLLIVRNRVAQALVRANQLRGQGNGKNGRGRKRRAPDEEAAAGEQDERQQGGAAAAEEGQGAEAQEPQQDLAALGAAAALPPVLANHSACSRCFQVAECMVFHRALEGGDAHTSALGGLFGEITGELEAADLAYLRKWETLVGLEAGACSQLGRDLWHRRGAVEEERTARTMGDMVCVDVEARNGLDGPSFLYRFARRKWADPSLSSQTNVPVPRPLHDLAVAVGDRVLVSTESTLPRGSRDRHALRSFRHINMGAGTVVTVAEAYCDVLCSKALAIPGYPGFPFLLPPREPAGHGAAAATLAYEQEEDEEGGAAGANGLTMSGTSPSPRALEVVFRLDRDQSALSFALMRYNLVRLFTGPAENINAAVPGQPPRANGGGGLRLAPTQGDLKRRRLVVHLDAPKFTRSPLPDPAQAASLLYTFGPQPPAGCHAEQLREEFARLNRDQQAAVEKVLTAKDYALLLGMPGTGKTWTIAFVVRALLCTGKSVLVTSYTHTAVDTLLLKLRECGVPFLRLGRASQVNPALHDSLLEAGGALDSSAALEARLSQAKVVGATCLGIRHPTLTQRKFDVCIVDEAGQILEPVCLGPLRSATSFVLVGDDNQLPPLVVSGAAQEGGMADSLFSRLARAHPKAVQRLTFQYRMNRDIMSVCNSLVYDNQLQCGDEGVAGATLVVPHPERFAALRAPVPADEVDPSWLERCLEPQRAVVFLDTDGISPDPLEDGLVPQGESDRDRDCLSNLTNPTEVRLVGQLVTALVVAGLRPEKLAVISPLRSQLKRLKRDLAHIRRLEINTVDKLQGTDRDCIIISMVRSNADGRIGDLLQDRRRINVAVSRAKKKLIIVGSAGTLAKAGATGDLVTFMQQRGWLLRLPAQAHLAYDRGLDVVSLLSYTQQ